MIRGFTRSRTDRLGNFWVDVTRGIIRLLIPIAVIGTIVLVAGGTIENLASYHTITTLAGGHQTIPGGTVASQEVIKDLGNNGGGWFNVNSAHPFENPNPFTNIFEIFLLLLIPFATPRAFGKMVGDNKQGYALVAAMVIIWALAVGGISLFETHLGTAGMGPQLAHGAYEGVESRFGPPGCSLFASSTTVTSTGAVNCFHDSLTPFGGGIALFDIALGEIAPGGIGAGMYGILILAMVTVFVAGLMVGRTPEYIGKKIQQKEVKMALFAILSTSFLILVGSAVSIVVPFAKGGYWNSPGAGIANLNNGGPHGLSEMLYAYTSASENNGSAFAGLTVNTPWYDLTLGLAMLFGRFLFIIPALAAAGSLATKKAVPTSAGTLPTHGPLFVGLLVATVIVVGALTFFPALSLGPIVEHLLMHQGKLFSTVFVPFPLWS
jgi:K+-transporting ATPase ATPase A chain